jgi:prolyl-tRNA editing enzyme YbaK/EbsC (Cys-tRNA(Pro) deacylase)
MTGLESASARTVQAALEAKGVPLRVVELSQSTRTAAEAAAAIGCMVAQIAKSLVFRGTHTNQPVLVIASGTNRVDEHKVAALVDEPVAKANAAFVREHTGFAIGGVAPVGHPQSLRTLVDQDLLQYEELWAAAGTPHAVFRLTPAELVQVTGGDVVVVAQ